MKVLITGGHGQLGTTLNETVPSDYQLLSTHHQTMDLTDEAAVQAKVEDFQPDLIINAGAYTQVDNAEDQADLAQSVNAGGATHIAEAAKAVNARLIQISTDYVFNGEAHTPYSTGAATDPRSVYGKTKLQGEQAVQAIYPERTMIIRTAWVYSNVGSNFLLTMLRLMSQKREGLGVIADQIGTPTSTYTLAELIWSIAASKEERGLYHCTDLGVASWYDFAVAINEEAVRSGLLDRPMPIKSLTTAEYPTKAVRPAYSVLDKSDTVAQFGVPNKHWRVALREVIQQLK